METSWVYELASGKTDLLCQAGYGPSLGCSSMHLSCAKVMVAEEPQAGFPSPCPSWTHWFGDFGRSADSLVLIAPVDTHIAVSRKHDTHVGALLSPFTLLAMLCAVDPPHVVEVSCMFVHSGLSLQSTTSSASQEAHQSWLWLSSSALLPLFFIPVSFGLWK